MMKLVTRNYWWLEVTKNVGKYVNRYDIYQRMKNWTEVLTEKLKLSEVPEKLRTYLMIVDFITKLSLVTGKNVILVVCDNNRRDTSRRINMVV